MLFIEELRQRLTVISLNEDDYLKTLEQAVTREQRSGKIHDALLLRCAAKSKAEVIYTWNIKHFQAIAPDLAKRIKTP